MRYKPYKPSFWQRHDLLEWGLGALAVILILLGIVAAACDTRLQDRENYCMQHFEKTADYILCVAPVKAQLQQEANDAAMTSAIISTNAIILSQ